MSLFSLLSWYKLWVEVESFFLVFCFYLFIYYFFFSPKKISAEIYQLALLCRCL